MKGLEGGREGGRTIKAMEKGRRKMGKKENKRIRVG